MSIAPPDWTENEPGARALGRAVVRATKRSIHRPALVVGVALAVALAVAVSGARSPRRTTARVTLRMTESGVERDRQRVPRDLRAHLLNVALSSRRLADIVVAHKLYPRFAETDMASALASFREDMEVEVASNYLFVERAVDDAPRSARVEISYTAATAQVATSVARELGDAVIDAESEQRTNEASAAAQAVGDGLEALRERYYGVVEARRAAEREDAKGGRVSSLTARLARQEVEMKYRLTETESQRTSLELLTRAEITGLGMRIDRVYEHASSGGGATPASMALSSGVVFLLMLPLAALLVGAYDPRVRDREDLAGAGVRVLGELPRAPRRRARRAAGPPV